MPEAMSSSVELLDWMGGGVETCIYKQPLSCQPQQRIQSKGKRNQARALEKVIGWRQIRKRSLHHKQREQNQKELREETVMIWLDRNS